MEEFVFDAEVNGESVECVKDGGEVVLVFPHPHQDPASTVLYILELLEVPPGNPDEECIT